MILSFTEHELKTKIGCNIIPNVFIEESIVRKYRYDRRHGTPFTSILGAEYLVRGLNMDPTESNLKELLPSMIPTDKLITITHATLDKLDVLLLMEIEDLLFKDILFIGKDKDVYKFEVMYE